MATKIPRRFLPLDLDFMEDPKIEGLPDRAEHLYIRLLLWAKQNPRTEGKIPMAMLPQIARGIPQPKHWIQTLDESCLVSCTRVAIEIHAWAKWNPTRDELDKRAESHRNGAKITNHKRGLHKTRVEGCPMCARYQRENSSRSSVRSSVRSSERIERGTLSKERVLGSALDAPALEGRRSGPASNNQPPHKLTRAEQEQIWDEQHVPEAWRNW